jgi:hypothetical protein
MDEVNFEFGAVQSYLGILQGVSNIVKLYNPPYAESNKVHNPIKENLEDWVEEAMSIRESY